MIWTTVAALTGAVTLFVATGVAGTLRRRASLLNLPLGFAIVVCLETVLVSALSPVGAVGRAGMMAGHVGFCGIASATWVLRRRPAGRRVAFAARSLGALPLAVAAVLGALTLASAVLFLPNNWDSMTYHLARVAHWLQRGSVEPYPTNVSRQLTLTPGAEYVIIALQAISGTDALAAVVQWAAWLACVLGAAPLARCAGAPRAAAPVAMVLTAAIPMALLQASSTQNDLVAAVTTMAVVVAALPFLHPRTRWRVADGVMLALAGTATLVVKPTAAIVATPVLLIAVVSASIAAVRDRVRLLRVGAFAVAVLLTTAVVYGPEALRHTRTGSENVDEYLYRREVTLAERATNALRGVVRHLPVGARAEAALAPAGGSPGCARSDSLCSAARDRLHEDYAGNPLHAFLIVVAGLVVSLRGRSLGRRPVLAFALTLVSWVLFHALLRDNVWISRLQTPAFVLAAVAVTAVIGRAVPEASLRSWAVAAIVLVGAVGARVAVANESRPLLVDGMAPRSSGYYANRRDVRRSHEKVLNALASTGCSRLGLFIGGDSYDYPLTWRAMQRGVEVRHLVAPDDWACLVFSDRGPPPPRTDGNWVPTQFPDVFASPHLVRR